MANSDGSGRARPESAAATVVLAGGWTPVLRLMVTLGGLTLVAMGLIVWGIDFIGIQKWGVSLTLSQILILCVAGAVGVGIFIAIPWVQSPREVRLDPSGVYISYPLRRVHLVWSEVMNVRYIGWGVVVFQSLLKDVTQGEAYRVTVEQAKAILASPYCSPVQMPESLRQQIVSD
jgi:hypothetical protein